MSDPIHVLQQYPDVLCLIAEHLNFKSWKSMRLVCKQFASWLRPYKQLMQERMCQAMEIHCTFFLFDEPFRGAYHIDQNPYQFAIRYGEGPLAQTCLHYLMFDPSVIWNDCFFRVPISITSELFAFRQKTTKLDFPSTCKGKFGETWRFCTQNYFSGNVGVIRVFLENTNIASYTLVVNNHE